MVRTEYQMRRAAADILRSEIAAGRSRLAAVPLVARVLEVSMIRACRLVCDVGPEWVVDQLTRWDLAVTVAELENWELMTQVPPPAVLRHLASLYEVPEEMLGFPGSP
jgi:DNA-binding transcriptional ArsR family regulator